MELNKRKNSMRFMHKNYSIVKMYEFIAIGMRFFKDTPSRLSIQNSNHSELQTDGFYWITNESFYWDSFIYYVKFTM